MIAAIFLPADPESRPFDLIPIVEDGIARGLRLYTNGRQFALLRKPLKGWAKFGMTTTSDTPPPEAA